jgi:hypothetical protein
VQRLTGSARRPAQPEISGTRVVWEDDRDGAIAIFGLELPSLDPVGDRRAPVGARCGSRCAAAIRPAACSRSARRSRTGRRSPRAARRSPTAATARAC